MMTTTPVQYRYAMNVKLSQVGQTPANKLFPHIEDMVMSSRQFEKFEDAINSANAYVAEFTATLNEAVQLDKYKTISEINPKFSGKDTISKEWAPTEIGKIWIIDKIKQAQNQGPILAIGLAQLLEVPGEPITLN